MNHCSTLVRSIRGGVGHANPLGALLNASDYDESEALKRYFNDNYQTLMTAEERQTLDLSWFRLAAHRSILKSLVTTLRGWAGRLTGRSQSDATDMADEDYDEILRTHLQTASDRVKQASLAKPPIIYQQIDDRIRRDYEEGRLMVNRCPECQRIVRTPLATQCLWCGHDWHGT